MEALERLGHEVVPVDTTWQPRGAQGLAIRLLRRATGWAYDTAGVNNALVETAVSHRPEVVWVDKGVTLLPATLKRVRDELPKTRLVSYSPDDMGVKTNSSYQYRRAIPEYDLHVTTKAYHVPELYRNGARAVIRLNCAYCPRMHRPVAVAPADRLRLGGPVGFIGTFEKDRAEVIWFLVQSGLRVRVWGGGRWRRWAAKRRHSNLIVENRGVFGDEYAGAICSFDILLGFLSGLSHKDLHTTRSVEIPACGGFLLAERTEEHLKLFEEGVEAEFFSSREELLEKCRYYLAHPEARRRVATAGRERCLRSDYSYDRHVAAVLDALRSRADGGPAYAFT